MGDLERDLAKVLNRHIAENGSNTPDFILAEYLTGCLTAFNASVVAREEWYGREHRQYGTANAVDDRQEALHLPDVPTEA